MVVAANSRFLTRALRVFGMTEFKETVGNDKGGLGCVCEIKDGGTRPMLLAPQRLKPHF